MKKRIQNLTEEEFERFIKTIRKDIEDRRKWGDIGIVMSTMQTAVGATKLWREGANVPDTVEDLIAPVLRMYFP